MDDVRKEMEELRRRLSELEGAVSMQKPMQAPLALTEAYPQVAIIRGAHVRLDAPIHPKWLPDMSALVFGVPGRVVGDPSNAPRGYAKRTVNGWPLHYGGLAWDSIRQEWVGVPMGPGIITNEGRPFNSEAEAEAWYDKRMAEVPDPMWGSYRPR